MKVTKHRSQMKQKQVMLTQLINLLSSNIIFGLKVKVVWKWKWYDMEESIIAPMLKLQWDSPA